MMRARGSTQVKQCDAYVRIAVVQFFVAFLICILFISKTLTDFLLHIYWYQYIIQILIIISRNITTLVMITSVLQYLIIASIIPLWAWTNDSSVLFFKHLTFILLIASLFYFFLVCATQMFHRCPLFCFLGNSNPLPPFLCCYFLLLMYSMSYSFSLSFYHLLIKKVCYLM